MVIRTPCRQIRRVRRIGQPHGQPGGTGPEKSAEAIVARPDEGPNLPNARSRRSISMNTEQQKGGSHPADGGMGGTQPSKNIG